MKAKDFHKIIRDTNACDNRAMAESLKADNSELFTDNKTTRASNSRKVKKRISIFAPLAIVVCLACILIPAILLTQKQNVDNDNRIYYCYSGEYGVSPSENTLKEISKENDNAILYFDWYDIGSDCATWIYSLNDTKNIICFNESIFNLETEDYIELYVSPSKYVLDIFSDIVGCCTNEIIIDNKKVKYGADEINAYGIFTYNSYTYYLTLIYNTNTQKLCSLINELMSD